MKITIGTTDFALGTSRGEPCLVQGLEGARQLNVVPLTRAAEPGIYDHGNVSHSLGMQVTRHHSSPGAAADYVLSHPAVVWALTGDTVIESPSGNKWKLSQAYVERCTLVRWNGNATTHSYVIRGGTLSAVTS